MKSPQPIDSRPLQVLITRPVAQANLLAERLDSLGYQTRLLPLMEIQRLELSNSILSSSKKAPIQIAETLIFISANAVRCSLDQLQSLGVDLSAKRMLAMGPATAAALSEKGFDSDMAESGFRSEDLLQKLNSEADAIEQVTVVCGEGGRDFLESGLSELGAAVNRLEVYRRQPSENIESALTELDQEARPDLISLMNQESLVLLDQAIQKLNLEHWKSIAVLVSSPRIQKIARDLGFLQVFCQSDPTENSLIGFLAQFSP